MFIYMLLYSWFIIITFVVRSLPKTIAEHSWIEGRQLEDVLNETIFLILFQTHPRYKEEHPKKNLHLTYLLVFTFICFCGRPEDLKTIYHVYIKVIHTAKYNLKQFHYKCLDVISIASTFCSVLCAPK